MNWKKLWPWKSRGKKQLLIRVTPNSLREVAAKMERLAKHAGNEVVTCRTECTCGTVVVLGYFKEGKAQPTTQ